MKTILVVDDEYALAETLVELFDDEGYRVVAASNGKDGLDRLQKERPDLVLVDSMMPILDGRGFIIGMRAIPDYHDTPVVMMSAASRTTALPPAEVEALKVSGFLAKPFQLETLLEVIEGLIGRGERRSEQGA
jgi:two-component system response regulator VicR